MDKEEKIGEDVQEMQPDEGNAGRLETFPQIPKAESDSAVIARIEASLDHLCLKLGDEAERSEVFEQMTQFFSEWKNSTKDLANSLDREIAYTRSLEDRLRHKNIEYDNIQLRKYLAEAQNNMAVSCDGFEKEIQSQLKAMNTRQENFEKSFNDYCDLFDSKINEMKGIQDTIDSTLNEYKAAAIQSSKNEYAILSADCRNFLNECNGRVGEIKKDVIDFLNTCRVQNQALIKKIPEQKRKFSWKDVMVYILCIVCITGTVLGFFR